MDTKDRQILDILQRDASLSMSELAERCALSKTAVWRRVRELEKENVIQKRVTLLDPEALGFSLTIYAFVRTNQHSEQWFKGFAEAVSEMPEVMEFYRLSGDIDYLLRVVVPDIDAFDRLYKRLIERVDLFDVSSSFAMEQIKLTTALPVDYAD